MIKKIEHIGIAVNSISEALPIFEALFDKKAYKTEIVDSEFVKTAFIRVGESKIELLEATNKSSAIAKFLEKNQGGLGILLSGSSYSNPAQTLIIGGGVVGYNAALIANGMQSKITILEKSEKRIEVLKKEFPKAEILNIDQINLETIISRFDLVIGAVLIPGSQAPKILQKKHLGLMKPGSVVVDVAIDQGGCFETSRATTHENPTYIVDDVIHYCVANMPGGVPRTSTLALNNATLPFLIKLANKGYQKALSEDKNFLAGLNVHKGQVTYKAVADVFGHNFVEPGEAIKH